MYNNTSWYAVVGALVMISACGEVDDGGFGGDGHMSVLVTVSTLEN